MCSREHAYFAADWTQIAVTTPIHAFLCFQNARSDRFAVHDFECLLHRKCVGLRKFFENRRLYLFSKSVDRFCARTFAFSAERLFDSIADNLPDNIYELPIDGEQLRVAL